MWENVTVAPFSTCSSLQGFTFLQTFFSLATSLLTAFWVILKPKMGVLAENAFTDKGSKRSWGEK